jgi:polyisoprenyl-phosphate glycosyltransferase
MKKDCPLISIVVPCYNEAENIALITASLGANLKDHLHEIILVDDGSTDRSRFVYEKLSHDNGNIHYIRLSRNFGHQAALLAGINNAAGDAIITIDADLQQPPSLIPQMIERWLAGAEIVDTVPIHTDSVGWFKKHSSYLFYALLGKIAESPVTKSANDFRLIDRKVADILKTLPENQLYLRGLFSWMGFRHACIQYRHLKRIHGTTRYPLHKLMTLALCGITSMSIKPLRVALFFGLLFSTVAFAIILWALYVAVFTDKAIAGWTSTIVSTVFLGGVQLLVLGIMGEYLGKLFLENKRRPAYIISETDLEEEECNHRAPKIKQKERRPAMT